VKIRKDSTGRLLGLPALGSWRVTLRALFSLGLFLQLLLFTFEITSGTDGNVVHEQLSFCSTMNALRQAALLLHGD
jgi:hypothetical protein